MNLLKNLNKIINDPLSIVRYFATHGYFNFMSDKLFIKIFYYSKFKKRVDLNNPQTFNEKIQWLKLNDKKTIYNSICDKYEVRNYIKENIGSEVLVPLMGVWESWEEIDFSKLTNQFVLKTTHDSGGVVVCKDKKDWDYQKAKVKIQRSLKTNYYYHSREWPYKNIKPRIICEEYLEDKVEKMITDYKFMCFNGKVKCIFVCTERASYEGVHIDIYDIYWNKINIGRKNYPQSKKEQKKPYNFEAMIKYAETLSKDFSFLRVDFYEVNRKVYIGELTLYPAAGFEEFSDEDFDLEMGSWLSLPK